MRCCVVTLLGALVGACGSGPPGPLPTPGAAQVSSCGALTGSDCSCTKAVCDIDCMGQTSCTANCSGGARCGVVNCSGDTECTVTCSGGSPCDYVDCSHVTGCSVNCSGGSRCNVNCSGDTGCTPTCSGGSPCLAFCGGTTSCSFMECSGGSGMKSCPNDIVVCNRPCPSCGDGVCDRVAGETCGTCLRDCGGC